MGMCLAFEANTEVLFFKLLLTFLIKSNFLMIWVSAISVPIPLPFFPFYSQIYCLFIVRWHSTIIQADIALQQLRFCFIAFLQVMDPVYF